MQQVFEEKLHIDIVKLELEMNPLAAAYTQNAKINVKRVEVGAGA